MSGDRYIVRYHWERNFASFELIVGIYDLDEARRIADTFNADVRALHKARQSPFRITSDQCFEAVKALGEWMEQKWGEDFSPSKRQARMSVLIVPEPPAHLNTIKTTSVTAFIAGWEAKF